MSAVPSPATGPRSAGPRSRSTPSTVPSGPPGSGSRATRSADTQHHGGVDQAVYAFAREDLDLWSEALGEPIRDGLFGENLTTEGYDVNGAEIGERWRIGSAVFEVASVRIPCNDFKGWLGELGFDNAGWVKRFTAEGRPGPYLRVVEEGELRAGDPIAVVHRPGHGVTVSHMFRALTTDRHLLPDLLVVEDWWTRRDRTPRRTSPATSADRAQIHAHVPGSLPLRNMVI